jgi:DNA-binding transcriptional LysR family regulator
MDKSPDWTLLRSFLAVAEAGSLSGAARVLGVSQPTLGRHVQDLEAALEVTLFTRAPRGLLLTPAGEALLPGAKAMRAAAAELSLVAAGRSESMTGPVRITASRVVASYVLPAILAELRQAEPGITIDLVPSDQIENLLFREADIALRMVRPTQLDIVTHHVCDLPMGLYAAPSYLNRRGRPQNLTELRAHDFVGLDRSDLHLKLVRSQGIDMTREDFPLRCDDQLVYIDLVRAGCGIGAMLTRVGDAGPGLERLADLYALPALPVWLAAPQALHLSPRLRRVFDFLGNAMKSLPPA